MTILENVSINKTYSEKKVEIHEYIKNNLEQFREKMLKHKEEQKRYIQSN
jgi:hypothetical protein